MFLASALKRGRHPPENIMKFNVPGGECLSLGHLLRTWPPAISVKTTLRFSHRSETSVCGTLWPSVSYLSDKSRTASALKNDPSY